MRGSTIRCRSRSTASSVQHKNHFVGQTDSSVVHLTGGEVRIYSDDISVARWFQRTIETLLHAPFADEAVPVLPAVFPREGDPRSTTVETIESDEDIVRVTWHDCIDPFILNAPPGTAGRPLGVLSTFIPAAAAQLALNDRVEFATLDWVDWLNHRRILETIGNQPPAEGEAAYHRQREHTALAAWVLAQAQNPSRKAGSTILSLPDIETHPSSTRLQLESHTNGSGRNGVGSRQFRRRTRRASIAFWRAGRRVGGAKSSDPVSSPVTAWLTESGLR